MGYPIKIHYKLEDFDYAENTDWSVPACRPHSDILSSELAMTTRKEIVDCKNCLRILANREARKCENQTGEKHDS